MSYLNFQFSLLISAVLVITTNVLATDDTSLCSSLSTPYLSRLRFEIRYTKPTASKLNQCIEFSRAIESEIRELAGESFNSNYVVVDSSSSPHDSYVNLLIQVTKDCKFKKSYGYNDLMNHIESCIQLLKGESDVSSNEYSEVNPEQENVELRESQRRERQLEIEVDKLMKQVAELQHNEAELKQQVTNSDEAAAKLLGKQIEESEEFERTAVTNSVEENNRLNTAINSCLSQVKYYQDNEAILKKKLQESDEELKRWRTAYTDMRDQRDTYMQKQREIKARYEKATGDSGRGRGVFFPIWGP